LKLFKLETSKPCTFNCSGQTHNCIIISADADLINILRLLESLVPTIDNYQPPLDFIIQLKIALDKEHFESPFVYNFKNSNFDDITQIIKSIDSDHNLNHNSSFKPLIETFNEIKYNTFNLLVSKTKIYDKYSIIWENSEDCNK
jgi:hypothetical protein